jgi:LPXTG-site transpeptidase (sortase) family protein
MARDHSSSRFVAMLNISWKLALILVLFFAQMSLIPGGVTQASAAPEPGPANPAPVEQPADDAFPAVSVAAGDVQLGSDFTISATFTSTGDSAGHGATGYGPFIDLYIPHTGPDGTYPGDTPVNQYDGISPVGGGMIYNATYLGLPLTVYTLNFTNTGTSCPIPGEFAVDHPLALDDHGIFTKVCGKPGDQLVVIQLPFGSFTPGQPPVTVQIPAHLSLLADVGTPLAIKARAGFQFGATPMVDWCCTSPLDTTILSDGGDGTAWHAQGDVQPQVFSFTKSGGATTATGPNFPHTYTLTVDIATGQTVSDIDITDTLPNNIYYLGNLVSSPSDHPNFSIVHQPAIGGPYAGEHLNLHYNSITGGDGPDIVVTFDYYIPQLDSASNPIIPPTSGVPATTTNSASVGGTWTPMDTRDAPAAVSGTGVATGSDRPLVVSKDSTIVVDTGQAGATPGDVVRYTVDFSISDYFALDDLVATDVIGDGQHFFTDATHVPQLVIRQNSSSNTYPMTNYSVVCDYTGAVTLPTGECNSTTSGGSGTTTASFNISSELNSHGLNTQLLGGLVPDGGPTNDGATTGQIIFFTKIQDRYSDQFGKTDVKQGDSFNDTIGMIGDLLDVGTCEDASHNPKTCLPYPGNPTTSGGGSSGQTVPEGALIKSIYAYNGTVCATQPCANVNVAPGDTVTYRIRYDLVTGDFAGLNLTDFLPLPIFKANDPNFDGSNLVTWLKYAGSNPAPDPGTWMYGLADTHHAEYSASDPAVSISGASANNSATFNFGSYDDPLNQPAVIDILFTVRVTRDPYADGLQMTNEAQQRDSNSPGAVSTTDKISQLTLTEPVLVSEKSVVSTNHGGINPTPPIPGPIVFAPPWDGSGPDPIPWTGGSINSTYLGSNNSALNSGVNGIDGSDLVKFAIVIQNTGSSPNGAFDITIKDILPSGYVLPGTGAEGINLQVFRGDRTEFVLDNSSLPVDSASYIQLSGGLLGNGIQIVDPKPGSLAYGHGACQLHDAASGNNVIIVTYDLKVDPNDAPGSQIENHGQLTNYSGSEGGPTYLPQPQDNPSDSTLANPTLTKTLVGTEIDNSTTTQTNGPTQAVIGEMATYQLTFTIPEGSSPRTVLTDTLPTGLAFVRVHLSNPADPSSYFTNSDAAHVTFTGNQAPIITSNGRTITIDLGSVINTDNHNEIPETLTWQYDAVVLNVGTNEAGTALTNSASMTWDRKDVQGNTVTGTSGPVSAQAVTIIEPNVNIAKTVNPTSGDAADNFTYTITITGATITDAFDVTLDDAIPAQMTGLNLVSVTDTAGLVHLSNFQLIGNTLSTLTPFDMPVNPPGRTIVLTITGSVSYSVNPQQNVDNNAIVRWTSLPGVVSGRSTYDSLESNERTGLDGVGGALNDYAKAGLGRFTVTSVGANKIFITTSEAHTPDSPPPPLVAIGEIVRYRLVVPIPESTSPNFQVLDNLPTGMTFLNDGTATLAFVSNGPGISSTGVGIVPAIPGGCTVSGATVNATTPADPLPCSFAPGNIGSDSSTLADADAYTTGTDVYFKFGNLVNNDNDPDTEFVVLEFNALVDNNPAGGNLAGKNLDNSFNVYVNGGVNGPTSNAIRVRVVEPAISMTKIANPTTGDAGDSITYSLAVSNTGTTTAFDVQVTDTAPLGITADMAGLTVSDPSSCAVGLVKSYSGNTADVRFSSIPAGCTLTISYTATVDYTVTASQVLTNTAQVTYSSLPGPNGTLGNPTGSNTPGASGTDTGERVYHGQASATFTINPVVPVKSIVATSDGDTPGYDLAIGEVLRYRLAVDIPEGTQLAFTIDDILPAGFTYIGNPKISFIDNSGMTLSGDLAGPAKADDHALPPDFPLPAGRVSNVGQHYTFTLGDIVNNDSDPGAESAVLEFDVRVNNDVTNNNTNTKANNFTVTIANLLRGTSNTVTATIVEPVLTINKTITHIDVTRDAGDIVIYQVTIAPDLRSVPDSTAYAYDVHFTDTLPGDLTFTPGSLAVALNGGAATLTNNSSGNLVDITVGTIPNTIGTSVVLTFSATLNISVTPGELITNTADLTWTSLAGPDANERNGSLVPAFNDYHAQSSASFNVHDPAFSKSLMFSSEGSTTDPHLTIGEVATFALKVTLPEGTTPALHISDDIPLGLQVVPGSAAIITSAAGSHGLLTEDFNGALPSMGVTITSPGGSGDDVSFAFTNPITVAVDAVDDPNNNSFLISFQAVVNNVSGNHSGISLPNSATMTVDSWTSGPSVASVLIVEPKLLVQKSVDNDHPRLGDTITYTTTVQYDPASTADAYNLVVTDTLPPGLVAPFNLTATSPSDCAGSADTSHSSGASVDVRVDHLPPACILTISYQSGIDATPSNFPPIGTVLTNAARLTWTSLPIVDADVRTGSGSSPNTYFANSSVPVTFANIDMVIDKSDGGVTANPGDLITYTLHYQNAGNITATAVTLTDVIPQYTTFHAASSTTGWSCADGAAAGTTCTFGIASVSASTSGDVLVVLQVVALVPDQVTSILNTATIRDDHTHGVEPTPLNNTSTDTTPLDASPDIAVAKTDGLDTVAPGETLPYVLTVSNNGNQDATGVAVTDTLPANTTFVSAGDNPDGQAASFNSGTGVVAWPVFDLAAGHSITLTVTVTVDNLLPAGVSTLTNTAQAQDDGTNGPDSTPADNIATDVDNIIDVANSDLSKILVVDSLGATVNPNAAIGEVMTYHITFNVPPGWMNDLTLTDQLDLGLAFVDCESITPSSTFLTWQDPPAAEATDFSPICTSPAVSAVGDPANPASPGRQVVFNFHNLHNGDSQTHSITVSVHAVILDVVENVSGRNDLNNGVTLDWNGGSLTTSAPTPLQIVEPKLTLQKTGDKNTTAAGDVITFTLTVAYDKTASTADAYDVLLTDILPYGLTYVPASLQYVSGNLPNSATPPSLDDTSAPTLRVHWDAFPSTPTGQAVIQFQATLGNIGPGNSVTNSANVEWTSLPGIPPSPAHVPPLPAGQESIYNDTAHERRYDPLHPADVYNVAAAFQVSMPKLPLTGFAPEQTTLLPDQPAEALYSDLGTLWLEIPSLGVTARIVGVPATSGAWDLTWLGDQIGYLYGTSYPTWSGNTGLTGHVYLPSGKPGPFANLHTMTWGQQIIVHLAGQQYIFEVRSVRRVLPDDLSVLGHAATPTLTLITCQGYDQAENDYHYRVVVRAVLVQILPDN